MEKTIEFVERLGVAALSCEGYARIDGTTYDLTPIVSAVFHTCAIVSAASRRGAADALDERATRPGHGGTSRGVAEEHVPHRGRGTASARRRAGGRIPFRLLTW